MAFGDFTVDRASKKYVLGSDGYLKEYANDEPAIEFNPDGSYKGVLVEPGATQLLGVTDAPATQSVTVTAVEHTLSFYGTGSVVLSGVGSGTLTGTGTDAERVSLTFTPTAGSLTLTVSGSPKYWQLETGAIATSYIKNTGAAGTTVTRLKDDIYLTGASSLIGQTEGTLFIEVDWQNQSGTSQGLLDVNDGSVDNRVLIYNSGGNSANMYIRGGGAAFFDQGVSSTSFTGIKKLAFTYEKSATATLKLFIDGTLESTGTNQDTSALTGLDEVIIGGQPTGSGVSEANMWIRAVALYTSRLTDEECKALTLNKSYIFNLSEEIFSTSIITFS